MSRHLIPDPTPATERFAARTAGMTASEIRALFAVASRPEVVGWELVPPAVQDRLVLAAESATLCPPSFTQMLVSRYLAGHDWRR